MTGGQSAVCMNARHSFPEGGLVELSRATYQSTPLAVVEIRFISLSVRINHGREGRGEISGWECVQPIVPS
jgi:hypothetical protein